MELTEVGSQCINCGHVQTVAAHNCARCGSFDLRPCMVVIDPDREYRNAVAVEAYRQRRQGWGND